VTRQFLIFGFFCLASLSYGSASFKYNQTSVNLLDAVFHCPETGDGLEDLAQASDFIAEISYSSPRPADKNIQKVVHTLYGSKLPLSATEMPKSAAQLTVTKASDWTGVPPGGRSKDTYECVLTKF
jgi:hypothetical protein